jgi:hypothetical protein
MKINDRITLLLPAAFLITFIFISTAEAYIDETHMLIARAAGYKKWYNAAAADIAKYKAYSRESLNHFADNQPDTTITAAMVLNQVRLYNNTKDKNGHLYGAIMATVKESIRKSKTGGKYFDDVFAYCVHYVGDLSMPLHNTIYNSKDPNDFNSKNHLKFEIELNNRYVKNLFFENCSPVSNSEIIKNISEIPMSQIVILSEQDLAEKIAEIANEGKNLGYKLKAEGRNMTRTEFLTQIGRSASLLKAIMLYMSDQGTVFEGCCTK